MLDELEKEELEEELEELISLSRVDIGYKGNGGHCLRCETLTTITAAL